MGHVDASKKFTSNADAKEKISWQLVENQPFAWTNARKLLIVDTNASFSATQDNAKKLGRMVARKNVMLSEKTVNINAAKFAIQQTLANSSHVKLKFSSNVSVGIDKLQYCVAQKEEKR